MAMQQYPATAREWTERHIRELVRQEMGGSPEPEPGERSTKAYAGFYFNGIYAPSSPWTHGLTAIYLYLDKSGGVGTIPRKNLIKYEIIMTREYFNYLIANNVAEGTTIGWLPTSGIESPINPSDQIILKLDNEFQLGNLEALGKVINDINLNKPGGFSFGTQSYIQTDNGRYYMENRTLKMGNEFIGNKFYTIEVS